MKNSTKQLKKANNHLIKVYGILFDMSKENIKDTKIASLRLAAVRLLTDTDTELKARIEAQQSIERSFRDMKRTEKSQLLDLLMLVGGIIAAIVIFGLGFWVAMLVTGQVG